MAKTTYPNFDASPTVDQVGIGDRITRIQKRSVKNEKKCETSDLKI